MASKKRKAKRTRPLQRAKSAADLPGPMQDVAPIIEFVEMFRELTDPRAKHPMKLISIKIPEPMLAAFRFKAARQGIPYQTMIKRLMLDWLRVNS